MRWTCESCGYVNDHQALVDGYGRAGPGIPKHKCTHCKTMRGVVRNVSYVYRPVPKANNETHYKPWRLRRRKKDGKEYYIPDVRTDRDGTAWG